MKRKCITTFFLALIAAVFSLGGWSLARAQQPQQATVISLDFEFLRQGNAGAILLTGPDMVAATATVMGRTFPFFPVSKGLACLLAVPLEQPIREYPIVVSVEKKDGGKAQWQGTLRVASGEFIAEPNFILPSDKLFLLREEVQLVEDAKLLEIYGKVTPTRYWDGPFLRPVSGSLISPFGSVRTYSDGSVRRHRGYDFRAATGTPVLASANGRVVFARGLDIHGTAVFVDHGWGVFSSYSHLSELYVVPGQFVLQGDVVGLSGNTGRSTGPHLHWEVSVNDIAVDPVAFSALKLPN